MKRFALIVLLLVCLTSLCAECLASEEGAQRDAYVHFMVLPVNLPDGSDAESAFKTFRAEMIMLAGGYSELGPSQGGSLHPEGVVSKDNVAYIVSANRDISSEIKKVTMEIFGIERVFILVWHGHLVR